MAKVTSLLFVVPVGDVERAVRFYCDAFDLQEVFRGEQIVFVGIPGTDTALGILHDPAAAGSGPQHVGLHLDHAINLDDAVRDIERAGGGIIERGEHAPGVPFARISDPDGNVLEV
ncbi:MAG TPA: VOC family protein [Dehalococcoidia bacterium]|nr:VOC family protein [Dehalococcoidia bacterium]